LGPVEADDVTVAFAGAAIGKAAGAEAQAKPD